MINVDKALEIARTHLKEEIAAGGLATLYGIGDVWEASCTFPSNLGYRENSIKIHISMRDGSVVKL
jgi:hypothetical protein